MAAQVDGMDYVAYCQTFKLIPLLPSNEIRFTDERDVNRTRTAYIDMNTRDAAKRASRVQGHIFGLQVVVDLAVHDVE